MVAPLSPEPFMLYSPGRAEIRNVARAATLSNTLPSARQSLLTKLDNPPGDWDSRTYYGVPGLVWTVESDTCATGRPNAPMNVAYDTYFREFVFRQPRDQHELIAIMSADSEEVFACYRFDGLERWTVGLLDAWWSSTDLISGWLEHSLATETDGELIDGLRAYRSYIRSEELTSYLTALRSLLGTTKTR